MNFEKVENPKLPDILKGSQVYTAGKLRVITSQEPDGWHLSISHPSRYPTWDEIKEARYKLIPNEIYMAMILPPQEQYVNVHPNCFHLWEIMGESV